MSPSAQEECPAVPPVRTGGRAVVCRRPRSQVVRARLLRANKLRTSSGGRDQPHAARSRPTTSHSRSAAGRQPSCSWHGAEVRAVDARSMKRRRKAEEHTTPGRGTRQKAGIGTLMATSRAGHVGREAATTRGCPDGDQYAVAPAQCMTSASTSSADVAFDRRRAPYEGHIGSAGRGPGHSSAIVAQETSSTPRPAPNRR